VSFHDKTLPPLEKRAEGRKRTLLGAKVVSRDGIYSCDCTIREISASGARIHISNAVIIASPFFLIDHQSQIMFEARIVWRNAHQAGLKFIHKHSMNNVEKLKLRFTRGG
jgi:hypothetical protein